MRLIALSTAFTLALTASAFAQAAIGGSYAVQGTNPNGTTYSGTAEIVVTSDTTCEIYWTTGNTTSSGICMRLENAFSAGYVLGDLIGLTIYEVLPDGSMQGVWTVAGQPGGGTENLTPL